MKILVIGESCTDIYTYGHCPRLTPEAPVPVFQPNRTANYGGMAMNVYENIKSMGVSVDIITNENYKDITKLRYVDSNTNHMFIRVDSNDTDYGHIDMYNVKKTIDKYDAVIISDYNKGFLSENDIFLIGNLHRNVFLDTKKRLGQWATSVAYIKINNFEYEDTKYLIDDVLYNILIVTMGEKGCKYKNKIYPVPSVNVKNTCGAGDTFIAALTKRYVETKNIEESIIFANQFAVEVIQEHGPVHTKTVKK